MSKLVLYISVISCICFYACKKPEQQGQQVKNMEGQTSIVDTVAKKKAETTEHKFIADFKTIFEEECKNWPVNFSLDTVSTLQLWMNNFNLHEHDSLVLSTHLLFVDGNIDYRSVSVSAFVLSSETDAIKIIDEHCEAYYEARRKGESSSFVFEHIYVKIPYRAIRIGSIIFEITSTNTVGHIMYNTIENLCDKYNIPNNDIVPCDRNHIEQGLVNRLRPKISNWLKFHKLDIHHFTKYGESTFETGHNSYTLSDEELAYKPKLRDYSPNRKYYMSVLEMATFFDAETNTYEVGFDDSQTIWLFDTINKTASDIQFFGTSSLCEAAAWIDNNTFVLLGHSYTNTKDFFIMMFDLKNKTITSYYNRNKGYNIDDSYFYKNLELRGISISKENR